MMIYKCTLLWEDRGRKEMETHLKWNNPKLRLQEPIAHSKKLTEKISFWGLWGTKENLLTCSESVVIESCYCNILLFKTNGIQNKAGGGEVVKSGMKQKALWVILCSFWETPKPQSATANESICSSAFMTAGHCFNWNWWDDVANYISAASLTYH